MSKITITEALAELKTISKRIKKKEEAISPYIYRQEMLRDPHEKDGGSAVFIEREMQAIEDLHERIVNIRRSIAKVNSETEVTVSGETRTIADWLVWRREILPSKQSLLAVLRQKIVSVREDAMRRGLKVTTEETGVFSDIVVNINEKNLVFEIEHLEIIEGELDGLLSLKNATIFVNI